CEHDPATEIHLVEHAGEPVPGLVVGERCDEAHRRASLHGVDQQVGEVVEVTAGGEGVEAADDHLGPAPGGALGHCSHGRRLHAGCAGASSALMPAARAPTYQAMVLRERGSPLVVEERPVPEPHGYEVVLRVAACAVCRTDLHVVDGELDRGVLPIVLGHQVVGRVVSAGPDSALQVGEWVGEPWLASTCGSCEMCAAGRENLWTSAWFTGCDVGGGFAELVLADSRFCLRLPGAYGDVEAAPLLCGGLIGFRALRMAGQASRLGLYGFGSAAHLIAQV